MSDLTLSEVRKVYRTKGRPEVEAVRGFTLDLRSGELVGLLGPPRPQPQATRACSPFPGTCRSSRVNT